MNHYGFNPFIVAVHQNDDGLLYDLLKGDVYQIPANLIKLFEKKIYTPYETLIQQGTTAGIAEDQIQSFLNEGMEMGIILEFPEPYWRNEIQTPFETGFNSSEKYIPGEYFNVWLQPSGKCDQNCAFCNSHVNCGCGSTDTEWTEKELETFLTDMHRYKRMLLKFNVHGGNPFLYPHIERLINGLQTLDPLVIRIVLPATCHPKLYRDKIRKFKESSKSDVYLSFNLYPNYWDIERVMDGISSGEEINLLLDANTKESIDADALKKRGFRINKKYLLKQDRSNVDWYKEKFNADFFESLQYNEFFMRKHLHKCWGCSFAINSDGELKPCLWSDQVFSQWQDGKVSHILIDDPDINWFYRDNNLENIDGCNACIYRFGCKDCRVTAEFLAGKRRAKNPLCDK
ncbi:MAG: radical SAM protein [Candidatus Omnitrophota bacterium]